MQKEELLNLVGDFTWFWDDTFFIETKDGNFVWSDPDYGGTNEIRSYQGSYEDLCKLQDCPFGRSKGQHIIRRYVGEDVKVV